jgi:hypothetical protein
MKKNGYKRGLLVAAIARHRVIKSTAQVFAVTASIFYRRLRRYQLWGCSVLLEFFRACRVQTRKNTTAQSVAGLLRDP